MGSSKARSSWRAGLEGYGRPYRGGGGEGVIGAMSYLTLTYLKIFLKIKAKVNRKNSKKNKNYK